MNLHLWLCGHNEKHEILRNVGNKNKTYKVFGLILCKERGCPMCVFFFYIIKLTVRDCSVFCGHEYKKAVGQFDDYILDISAHFSDGSVL